MIRKQQKHDRYTQVQYHLGCLKLTSAADCSNELNYTQSFLMVKFIQTAY